jgi:hypothetical protein
MAESSALVGSGFAEFLVASKVKTASQTPEVANAVVPLESGLGSSGVSSGANGISATSFRGRPVTVALNLGDATKLLKLLQRSSNNIVPFLRGVSNAPISVKEKASIIERAIGMVGGAAKFMKLLKSFAPAAGFVAKRLNPALLAFAVIEELDNWFGRGVAPGTIPYKEPSPPQIKPVDPYNPSVPSKVRPSHDPYPFYPESPLPDRPPVVEPASIPTEAQITAQINLESAQSNVASAKNAVDQDFAHPPILGVEGFRDDVSTLASAVKAYDTAIAAAGKVGLQNLDDLVKQFQSTAAQALKLLADAPGRAAQLKAAEDKRAANLYPNGLKKPDDVLREINFGSFSRFMTYVGGVSGLVEKGLIKTPADFANLFGRKMFQQDELNLLTKSLQNFIANPGQADKALVNAAQFLVGCIQAPRDPLLSFRFPGADDMEKAGKVGMPLHIPRKDPGDPFKLPSEADKPNKVPGYSPSTRPTDPFASPNEEPAKPGTANPLRQKPDPLIGPKVTVPKPDEKPGTDKPPVQQPRASSADPSKANDSSDSAAPSDGTASSSSEPSDAPATPSAAERFLAKRLQEAAATGTKLFERLQEEGWTFSVSHNKPYAVAPSGNAYPLSADSLPTTDKNFNRGFTQSWTSTVKQNLDKALKAEAGEIRWPGPGNVINLGPKSAN